MQTTPIYQMFDLIAQSGVGNLGNVGLILIQIFVSLFFELKFLFSAIRKRPPMVQFSVCMIPVVLIATYTLACGIFFSAFLGKGPALREMTALVQISLSRRSIAEIQLVVWVFVFLALVYSVAYRLNLLQWILTFGIETLAALALLVLYGGLLIPDFPFTILDLCAINIYYARWMIYGYFTILFKCFVLATSLVIGFLLRERKPKPQDEAEKYSNPHRYYERKTLQYLTDGDGITGISCILFSVAAELFFLSRMIAENQWDPESMGLIVLISALFMMPGGMGVLFVYRALRPRSSKAYRQLLAMGDKTTILRLFCKELVDGNFSAPHLWNAKQPIQTPHFLFWQQNLRSRVEWRKES